MDQTSLCRHYLSFRAVASQVFSAQVSLTTVFGMGTGGPSLQSTPTRRRGLHIIRFGLRPKLTHSVTSPLQIKTASLSFDLAFRARPLTFPFYFNQFPGQNLCYVPPECPHSRGSGTPSGTRTLDTLIKSQVLYQLS